MEDLHTLFYTPKKDGKGTNYASEELVSRVGDKGATVTLYANWEAISYPVYYNLNGGNQPKDKNGNILNSSVHTNVSNITLKNPTRDGYAFDGWYKNAEFTGTKVTSIAKSRKSVTLYAKWKPVTYKITYNFNNGTLAKGVNKPTTFNIESDIVVLPVPTRTNYDFAGWYTNKNFTGEPITQIASGSFGNKTIYAKWVGVPYKIMYSYFAEGGLESGVVLEYNYSVSAKTPTAEALGYINEGYKLTGWTAYIKGQKKTFKTNQSFVSLTNVKDSQIVFYPIWTRSSNCYMLLIGMKGEANGQ